ncbi:MAG: S41 family peptidase [Ferruginibacter sp.]
MEKKKIQAWLPLLFSITMIAGIYLGYKMRDEIPGKSFFYMEKRRPVQEIMDLIKTKYVDDVDINNLADTAIQAMLSKLDPHSVYIPAKDLQQVNEEIAGSFYGIGIEFGIFDDSLHVINVLKDGPSYKAGIRTGDKFLQANGHPLSGKKIDTDSVRSILRGSRGSAVDILIIRGTEKMTIRVTRDMIPLTSVDASYMIDSSTGYIRLNKFSQQTYREFMQSLEGLKKQGLKKLIFDLRGNGGGVLDEAVEIADEFLDGDKLITYTIGKHVPKKEYRCRREGQFEKGELVVLSDEGTASASEVIIGALQDWDRATIIGRRTFGKGLVQDQFDLSDNSALRLTIARYYTPMGRSIQRSYANGGKAYYEEAANRYHNAENYTADSIKNDSSKIFRTPSGKKVFGGGGITPDYFIPADTGRMGSGIEKIYLKGLLNDYGYKYYLLNPSIIKTYKTADQFARSFELTEDNWKFFEGMSMADSIDVKVLNDKEKMYLYRSLKTSIARQLWRNEGYFEVMNMDDITVKKALEVLRSK